jgi:hypothetical protein
MVLSPLEQKALGKLMPTQKASMQFAEGFSNGIYGDVAILAVLAGGTGLLGNRIKHNIHWAIDTLYQDINHNPELSIKIVTIYLYHHQAYLVGKLTSGQFTKVAYKAAGVAVRYLGFTFKALSNTIALIVVGMIAHREQVESLQTYGKLAMVAYIASTGDTNLTNFKPNQWRENPPSLKVMNQQYNEATMLIDGIRDLHSWVKQGKK